MQYEAFTKTILLTADYIVTAIKTMEEQEEQKPNGQSEHSTPENNDKPHAYRVDEDGVEEKDLRRNFLFGDESTKEIHPDTNEQKTSGSDNFGGQSTPPTGNDAANPSQYAGETNARLGLTDPAEEHPENSNFKDPNQAGEPDYEQAQPKAGTPNED